MGFGLMCWGFQGWLRDGGFCFGALAGVSLGMLVLAYLVWHVCLMFWVGLLFVADMWAFGAWLDVLVRCVALAVRLYAGALGFVLA